LTELSTGVTSKTGTPAGASAFVTEENITDAALTGIFDSRAIPSALA
jgi:hypothetical protein